MSNGFGFSFLLWFVVDYKGTSKREIPKIYQARAIKLEKSYSYSNV